MLGFVFMYVVEGLFEVIVLGVDSMNGGMLIELCFLFFDLNLLFIELIFFGLDILLGFLF